MSEKMVLSREPGEVPEGYVDEEATVAAGATLRAMIRGLSSIRVVLTTIAQMQGTAHVLFSPSMEEALANVDALAATYKEHIRRTWPHRDKVLEAYNLKMEDTN